MMRRTLVSLATLLAAGGCVTKPPPAKPPYYGPTDDLATLVEKLNARNDRLKSLRAEGSFSADLVDPQTKKRDGGDGDVTLLYKPGNLRLVAKVFTARVFDIGSNDERYWIILPRQDQMFWGTHAAEPTGRAAQLPVRPDVIAEVLGVTPLSRDLLQLPAPALRFNNDEDVYMLTFQARLYDRWAVQKEVWYDRETLQPRRLVLYDPNGRVVLRSAASEPKVVEGYDPPLTMPSRYDLLFADSGSTFSLRLKNLDREQNGAPNARSFAFPAKPGVSKVESLDR